MTLTPDQRTRLAPEYSTPDYIERAITQTVTLPLYMDGNLYVPDSGTLTMLDAAGQAVTGLSAVVVALVGDYASYEIAAATVPATLSLSDQWQEVWTLVIDGVAIEFRREAALVRNRLRPVISDRDLEKLHTEIRAWLAEDQGSAQGYIDAAWDEVQIRLMEQGNRPYLIMSNYALRTAHLDLALANLFRDYSSSAAGDEGKYEKLAAAYQKKWEQDFQRIKFRYDLGEDGLLPEDKQSNVQPLFSTVPGNWQQ